MFAKAYSPMSHHKLQSFNYQHSIAVSFFIHASTLQLLRSLFIFITPIILSLDLISWSYPFSASRPFHGLLLITPISFTLFITCRSLSFTSVSPLFHLCFTFVSLSSVMSYHILCIAMYSRVQLCAASPCSIYIQ